MKTRKNGKSKDPGFEAAEFMEDRQDDAWVSVPLLCEILPSPPQQWYVYSSAEAAQAVILMELPSAPVYITITTSAEHS